jgi:hypothetical protein
MSRVSAPDRPIGKPARHPVFTDSGVAHDQLAEPSPIVTPVRTSKPRMSM